MLLMTLTACGGVPKAGDATSLTHGAAIWMKTTDSRSSHALYIVEPDGVIRFGGGYTATRNETDWEGRMSPGEADALITALKEANWFDGPPATTPVAALFPADTLAHEVAFAWPTGSWRIDAEQGGGDVRPVRELLRDLVAEKRHGELFDQLPEAGPN